MPSNKHSFFQLSTTPLSNSLSIVLMTFFLHRWKYHEVCLLSLGFIQRNIMEMLEANQLKFDADAVLIKLMVESCQSNGKIVCYILSESEITWMV